PSAVDKCRLAVGKAEARIFVKQGDNCLQEMRIRRVVGFGNPNVFSTGKRNTQIPLGECGPAVCAVHKDPYPCSPLVPLYYLMTIIRRAVVQDQKLEIIVCLSQN